jgi:ATP-dependent Clp protease ATP-binding subunit ClpB
LKRVIQREILDPLSLEILDGRFAEGDHIAATEKNDRLEFSKE